MTSWSSRSSTLYLAGLAFAGSVATATSALAGGWGTALLAAASMLFCAGLVLALAKARQVEASVFEDIAAVCRRVSKGDFEARITQARRKHIPADLQDAVNDMIDACDSYVRESAASLDAVSRGVFYRRILREGLHGAFLSAAEAINAAVETCKVTDGERRKAASQQADLIKALALALTRLADRDLTFRLECIPEGYEQVRDDFNNAMGQLETALQQVAQNAVSMNDGTLKIENGAGDLSRRAQGQATSLRNTAMALSEITMAARTATDHAEHARKVVAETHAFAEKSGDVVHKAVDAMGKIEKSSQQIGQIIGMIDEIAFQTNLLALNAGVEAARAGEAGRGFAVVASEVRALAQRSAEAAKEIKTLVSSSSAQVGEGVELVAETGRTLDHIMGQVRDINRVVCEIATGAQGQMTSLRHVDAAVKEFETVTDKNILMSEEVIGLGQSLAKDSLQLTTLVGAFRLGTTSRGLDAERSPTRAVPMQATRLRAVSAGRR